MSIKSVAIRAVINFGGLSIATPYILSFNVTKTRNSKATFSASLKISSNKLSLINNNVVVIYAGEAGDMTKIFTGYVLATRPSICFDDPNYTILNISGSDVLFKLEGEKYTRRVISSKARWAVIEDVIRKAEKGSQFQLTNQHLQIIDRSMVSAEERRNKSYIDNELS
ncbi:hypothetical protein JZU46_00080, partial [bacterium]|nr:hypothetical protein [bacterium]